MRVHSRMIFFAARLIPNLLGIIATALLTRLLDPAEYGRYALGLSITFFLTIGVFEWLGLSLLRMAPAIKYPDLFFGTVLTCFCSLCGIIACTAMVALLFGGNENYLFLIAACLLATFAAARFELKQRLQLAELRGAKYFCASVGRSMVATVLVCVVTYIYRSAPLTVLALAVSYLLGNLVVREARLSLTRLRFNIVVCRDLMRFGLPLSMSIGLGMILVSVGKWLLQGMAGSEAVGFFTAATLVTQTPIAALASGLGPPAYAMAVEAFESRSPGAANALLAQNLVVLLGIVVPAAAGVTALSANIAHLIFGSAYWHTVILLAPWLSAAAVLSSVQSFYVDIAFQLAHRTVLLIWTMLFALALNVALDIMLIPKLGELGAAVGSLGALFGGLVVTAVVSRGIFRLPIPLVDTAKILASTGIMVVALRVLAKDSGGFVLTSLQIVAGSLIYGIGMIALNAGGVRQVLTRRIKVACCAAIRVRSARQSG
jgi:O-antigen/teichoic acid export membrane protein